MPPRSRSSHESPGRPREFDRETALEKAMQVFWEKGFAKTTYAELENATGLHRQSLVYAFGDKRSLFNQVLNRYAETRVQAVQERLNASGSPLANIHAVFDGWLEDARRQATTGCLMVNTSGELGQSDAIAAQTIETSTQQLLQAFQQAFQRGQACGEVSTHLDAADLARQAMAIGDGALLRSKASGDSSLAEAAFRSFLATIRPR